VVVTRFCRPPGIAGGEHRLTDTIQHYLAHPDEFHSLVQAAVGGDTSILPEVRALLEAVPEWADHLGNLLQQSEHTVLAMTVGQNLLKREAIQRDLDVHEQRLREEPSYVEELLIKQLRLDMLMLYTTQQRALERRDIHSDKLLNSAHRRFLATLKSLEQLRKFAPSIRIQVAQNQINMS
jgi:hypothetical protein